MRHKLVAFRGIIIQDEESGKSFIAARERVDQLPLDEHPNLVVSAWLLNHIQKGNVVQSISEE